MKSFLSLILLTLPLLAYADPNRYELLSNEKVGQFNNYHFLIPDATDRPTVESAVQGIINEYCTSASPCNVMYFWKTKEAYKGLMYKREVLSIANYDNKDAWLAAERKWKKKHWKYVCENLYAIYNGTPPSEVEYWPYLDADYKSYGGNKKRPQIDSRPMTPQTKTLSTIEDKSGKEPESNPLFSPFTVLLAIGIGWWAYRRLKK